VPVTHGVHPARRPSGVLLLTRVTSLAALDGLRGFKLEQEPETLIPNPDRESRIQTHQRS
ncbi:hypothetical protein, partial [Lysobacter sp. Root690]|uniref:hypothetical protein n=1 Tax=Lysobacter sp. Root690 TaxID=1736588 RepID=UPI001F1D150B